MGFFLLRPPHYFWPFLKSLPRPRYSKRILKVITLNYSTILGPLLKVSFVITMQYFPYIICKSVIVYPLCGYSLVECNRLILILINSRIFHNFFLIIVKFKTKTTRLLYITLYIKRKTVDRASSATLDRHGNASIVSGRWNYFKLPAGTWYNYFLLLFLLALV